MRGMTRDVKMLAALHDTDSSGARNLLDAARKMTSALSDLLSCVQPGSQEPRSNLLGAATRVRDTVILTICVAVWLCCSNCDGVFDILSVVLFVVVLLCSCGWFLLKVGEASGDIVRTAGIEENRDQAYSDQLMDLAKAVANATANLVLKAKTVSSQTKDEALQNKVITTATQCALATSQLVSCAKVKPYRTRITPWFLYVNPLKLHITLSLRGCTLFQISVSTINDPACQEQVIEAAKLVAKSIEAVMQVGQVSWCWSNSITLT